jgi:PAS domain S-box-containing protein
MDGPLHLLDLVDLGHLQELVDGLTAGGGIGLGVMDLDGNLLAGAGWQDICTQFHRAHPKTLAACVESDVHVNAAVEAALPRPTHMSYRCASGLNDVAYPVIIDGQHVANVYTGQFLYEDDAVDREAFRARARDLGFDEPAYLAALDRVPVITHTSAENTIRFLGEFAAILAELGARSLEQQRALEELRASEERYRSLADDLPAYISTSTADGVITYANSALAALLGETATDIEGRHIIDIMGPEVGRTLMDALASLTPAHPVESHVECNLGPNGREHWSEWTNRGFFDDEGRLLRCHGIGRDVTESHLAEEALRRSKRLHETFLNATDDLAFVKDADLRYLLINDALAGFFGRDAADVVGRTDEELMPPGPSAACRASDLAALDKGGVVVSYENASERVYESRKFPVSLTDGSRGVGGYLHDITDRRRAEDEVARLHADLERRVQERTAELEAANQELESFSYSVSHDLRAPLRAIDGFSLVLLEDYGDALDETGREHLDRIRNADQKMGVLIDSLLRLSRLNRGELQRESVDLGHLAQGVAEALRQNEPEREVQFVIPSGLTVFADRTLVRVLLENLLGNAWRFTGRHETARIEVGAAATEAGHAFYVRDDGAGFDMAYAGKLFGAFQRLHTPGEFEGTGIGLATVQRIVRRHGGLVWAYGEVEKGATFWFTLPTPEGPWA